MTDFLEKTLSWIQEQAKKQKNRSKAWKWILGLGIGGTALVALGIFYLNQRNRSRELAKLRHERDLKKEELKAKEIISKVEDNAEAANSLKEKIDTDKKDLVVLDENIALLELDLTKSKEAIHALQNWDDVDRYLADSND